MRCIDKTGWPRGPWCDEPDEETFVHYRLDCLILRMETSGVLNGYVRVPDDKIKEIIAQIGSEDNVNHHYIDGIRVHGGISHSGELQHREGYWIGFDTAHAWDHLPLMNMGGTYKDIIYVRKEVRRLAEQIARLVHWHFI